MIGGVRTHILARRLALAASLACLLIAPAASAAPHLTLELTHSPSLLPRNYEQLTYLLNVKNTATANPSPGDTVICNGVPAEWGGKKTWAGTPVAKLGFTYQWFRNGAPIGGASGSVAKGGPLPTYTVVPGDTGAAIQCQVTGTVAAANPAESMASAAVSQRPLVVEPQPSTAPPAADLPTEAASRPTISTVETTKRLCKAPTGWSTSATATTTSGSNVLTAVSAGFGFGSFTLGSNAVTGVTTEGGIFHVGQTISSPTAGIIPAGTTIAAVGNGTLELSAAALSTQKNKSVTAGSQPFAVGKEISGAGIPVGTTITAVNGQTLELSASATASATGVVISSANTAEIGTWKNYRWLRNGSAIAGATSEKYEPLISTAKTTSGSNSLTEVVTTKGTGTLSSGSATITGVTTTIGSFLVGQTVNGEGIPASTTVISVGASTIELSAAATASGTKALGGGALPFAVGQVVSGTGIPAGATITAVSGQTLTISANATSSNTGGAISAQAPATVTTTAGSSSVTSVITSATGTGNVTSGSKSVSSVITSTGSFLVGQPISGTGIVAGTVITAVGSGTLELSIAANATVTPSSLTAGATQPFAIGQSITGPGIPAGTTITAVSGSTLTLSVNATASGSGIAVWGRTGGPDNNVELQCGVAGENAGGIAISVSNNNLVGVNPLGVETAPSNAATNTPTAELPNATSGTVSVHLELPAGQETGAFAIHRPGNSNTTAPIGWTCVKSTPTPLEHAGVTCTRSDTLSPQQSFPGIAVATGIGLDALDPLAATATLTGGGSAAPPAVADELPFAPPVPFAIDSLSTKVADGAAADYTQAGGHPFSAAAAFEVSRIVARRADMEIGEAEHILNNFHPVEEARDVLTDVPAGFLGNPRAVTEPCESMTALLQNRVGAPTCPAAAAVGSLTVALSENGEQKNNPVFLLEPGEGQPALLGTSFETNLGVTPLALVPELRPDRGYALRVVAPQVPKVAAGLQGASVTLCGYGEKLRAPVQGIDGLQVLHNTWVADGCKSPGEPGALAKPFLINPTECANPAPTTKLSIDSWEHPGTYIAKEASSPQATGCNNVPFSPKMDLQPTSHQADSPTGLDVSISVPTEGLETANGITQGYLKRAVVTLPQGMVVNPSAANGLGACTQAQLGMENGVPNDEPVDCPDSSKIGSAEVSTPILEKPLTGAVYIAKQGDNPFKTLLALYLVVESKERGILIKIPGKVEPDPQTGQLKATFDDNPQAPIESVDLHFTSGNRAALLNPPTCGSYDIVSELTPWSAADPDNPTPLETRTVTSTYKVTSGPGGGPCPEPPALSPKLKAGVANPVAGSVSPLTLSVSREDGTKRFNSLDVTLPPGLSAYLKGIPYCSDATLETIPGTEGTGLAELASPGCPAASQIGTATVGAGGGSEPFYVSTGRAYLAGPYKGAPLSIAVVAPAVAGPFDLGNVVVRSAVQVNLETAQITSISDPIPTILHGIPLDLRDIRIDVNRAHFTLAPTNCEPMSVSARVGGEGGGSANVSDRFQVGECDALGFKPNLKLSLKGPTKRAGLPALKAVVTYPEQGAYANIAHAQVGLPHSEFLEQANLDKVCTQPELKSATCPPGSVYGYAKAWTPLLDNPLEGPVYIGVGYGHKLPDLVADLNGQVRILLHGRVDTTKQGGLRNTFEVVPDAPVSRFVLEMKGGKKYGLLTNSENICSKPQYANSRFVAQNGKAVEIQTKIANDCNKKKRPRR